MVNQQSHAFPPTKIHRERTEDKRQKLNQEGCNTGLVTRGSPCTYS